MDPAAASATPAQNGSAIAPVISVTTSSSTLQQLGSPPQFSEATKQALIAYASSQNSGSIDTVLSQVILDIATTGVTCYEWPTLKRLIINALYQKLVEFNGKFPDFPTFEVVRDRVLSGLDSFTSVPFTIQRICELIVRPEKHYKSTRKLLFALEKMVTISTTQDVLEPEEYNHVTAHLFQSFANPTASPTLPERYLAATGVPSADMSVDVNSGFLSGPIATSMPSSPGPHPAVAFQSIASAIASIPQPPLEAAPTPTPAVVPPPTEPTAPLAPVVDAISAPSSTGSHDANTHDASGSRPAESMDVDRAD